LIRTCARGALILSALLVFTGCGGPTRSYDEAMRLGLADQQDERFLEALEMFQQAAALDRERPEPSCQMGRCYLTMARQHFDEDLQISALAYCDRAIACFGDAIGAFPGYGDAIRGQAQALRLKGRHAAALEIADWAAKHSGSRARKLILKARLLAQTGDMDQAQLAFKQATSVEPDNAAAHAELGLFYWRCGNEREAIRSLKRAYELNAGAPGVVTALTQLDALPDASELD
jgi:tetratricopeptide (TPR) repeat protein